MVTVRDVKKGCNKYTICRQGYWSERWLRPVEEAQAQTLGHTLGDEQTRILFKTLAFKLEVVANTLVETLPDTLADVEATTP